MRKDLSGNPSSNRRPHKIPAQGAGKILFGLLLFSAAGVSSADWRIFDYAFVEREILARTANHVAFEQLADTPVVYRVSGVWSFKHPASEVAAVALDFDHYPRIFRYVYRCDRVADPPKSVAPLGTWYVEGRAAFARVWAIGNIDTLTWTDSTHLRFIVSQNETRQLESKWSYQEPGWLNYRTHGVHLAAFVVGEGRDSCRVGIVAQGWVRHAMPQWLIRLATNIVLPQLLQDIDSEVGRRIEARKPKAAAWYKTWYHAVFGFFAPDSLNSR
jgi:hypothetical protein